MKNKNYFKIKIFGFILMFFGLFLILYPLTNLSYNEYISDYRYNLFVKNQENVSFEEIKKFENFSNEYNQKLGFNSGNIVDPFDYTDYKSAYGLDVEDKEKVFGYIKIPKIDVKKPIRFDATYENLSKGLAHVDGTSLPIGGIGTRSVIAGHRGWYTDVMFLNLHKLEKEDEVEIELIGGKTLKYVVKDFEIIEPSQWEKITPIENKDMLTLLTCDPIIPPSPYRLIVNCERVKENEIEIKKISKNNTNLVKKNINYTKYAIYIFTSLFWIIFIFSFIKFVKFILKIKK